MVICVLGKLVIFVELKAIQCLKAEDATRDSKRGQGYDEIMVISSFIPN
jgi:hypothetical protein